MCTNSVPHHGPVSGAWYAVILVDSAFRFQRPYGTRDKSTSFILGVVKFFVADMGVPRVVRNDSGAEHTNSTFIDYCNSLGICRKLAAPYAPQKTFLVENGLSRAIKAGRAVRIEVNKLFPDMHLEKLKRVRYSNGSSLCLESVLWAFKGVNHSAMTADSCIISPFKEFYGGRPPMSVLPFCKPTYHRVPRREKMCPQSRPCLCLNFGHNYGSDCFKVMDAETGMVVHSRDVT